jgi:hypothetical protein
MKSALTEQAIPRLWVCGMRRSSVSASGPDLLITLDP